jgi:hypothetical protein
MNAHLPNVTISNALREVAMIAEVKTSALGLTRTDKRASARTTEAHHAHSNAARVSVNRMAGADELHRDITSLQEQTRVNLHGYSTAWGSTSRRLLPNANFEPWIREHARIQGEFEAKLVLLRAEAPALVARATAALGEFDVKPSGSARTTSARTGSARARIPARAASSATPWSRTCRTSRRCSTASTCCPIRL